jgi:hypothetical protein
LGGEAPNATLGLDYDIRAFVPFGTLGYMHVHSNKQDAKNVLITIIGLDHDGHGYRAIRVTDGLTVTSIKIKVQSRAMSSPLFATHRMSRSLRYPLRYYCNKWATHLDVGAHERYLGAQDMRKRAFQVNVTSPIPRPRHPLNLMHLRRITFCMEERGQ